MSPSHADGHLPATATAAALACRSDRLRPPPGRTLHGRALDEVAAMAVGLASLAGAGITAALGRQLTIHYKDPAGGGADPVSDADRAIERLIRDRLAARFPGHGVIGEEMDGVGTDADVVWVIDPIDGTSNFINGFPWFSASIGVLDRGLPVAGAIWCSTSPLLRAGVYHAALGGPLCFDGEPVVRRRHPEVRRRLGAETRAVGPARHWNVRRTGSTAMECALVAAGALEVAVFDRPYLWDVVGGIVLAQAAGSDVHVQEDGGWIAFERFAAAGASLSPTWRRPLIVGEPAAAARACRLLG